MGSLVATPSFATNCNSRRRREFRPKSFASLQSENMRLLEETENLAVQVEGWKRYRSKRLVEIERLKKKIAELRRLHAGSGQGSSSTLTTINESTSESSARILSTGADAISQGNIDWNQARVHRLRMDCRSSRSNSSNNTYIDDGKRGTFKGSATSRHSDVLLGNTRPMLPPSSPKKSQQQQLPDRYQRDNELSHRHFHDRKNSCTSLTSTVATGKSTVGSAINCSQATNTQLEIEAEAAPIETSHDVTNKSKVTQPQRKFYYRMNDIKVVQKVGEGVFAKVFKVEILANKKIAALKVPKSADAHSKCLKEVLGIMGLSAQRNILSIHGMIKTDFDDAAFLLEFCELGSLDKLHDKFDLKQESCFYGIARGIFMGLMHLHIHGFIHREIACRNLLVRRDWSIAIADFNLAVRSHDANGEFQAVPGESLPWPWMAPEALKYLTFSFKSDVWAAGVALWEVLNKGKVPYSSKRGTNATMNTISLILKGSLKLPVKGKYKKIVMACLEGDRHLRPDACDVFIDYIPGGRKYILQYGTKEMRKWSEKRFTQMLMARSRPTTSHSINTV